MRRRDFVRSGALGGAALLGASPAARAIEGGVTQPTIDHRGSPADATFDLEEATIVQLQRDMVERRRTARSITEQYLARIESLDRRGPSLQIDRYAAEFRITALDRHIRDRTVFITFIGEAARSSGGMQPHIVGDALSGRPFQRASVGDALLGRPFQFRACWESAGSTSRKSQDSCTAGQRGERDSRAATRS